jgi:hypothetical protein
LIVADIRDEGGGKVLALLLTRVRGLVLFIKDIGFVKKSGFFLLFRRRKERKEEKRGKARFLVMKKKTNTILTRAQAHTTKCNTHKKIKVLLYFCLLHMLLLKCDLCQSNLIFLFPASNFYSAVEKSQL